MIPLKWTTQFNLMSPLRARITVNSKSVGFKSAQIELKDLCGREIKDIAEKAAKMAEKAARMEMLTELKRCRVSPSSSQKMVVLMMSRLGIPVERIAARLNPN